MKRAMSLVDNVDLDALEFSGRDEQWQSVRRRSLACIACGAPAFFRAASAGAAPRLAPFTTNTAC